MSDLWALRTRESEQIPNEGHKQTIFGNADYRPYPLKQFDSDGDGRIDDSEFTQAMDAWLRDQMDDETFLEAIDVWLFQALMLDEKDNEQEITLNGREMLVLTLESNPSTGFRWEVAQLEGRVLQSRGEPKWQPYDSTRILPGMGGWEIFHFKAAQVGQSPLKLVYHRPWETNIEPLETFTAQVVVR